MIININLLDSISNAVLICDSRGAIKKINLITTSLLLKIMGTVEIASIYELDPQFKSEDLDEGECITKKITLKELHLNVNIYKIDYDGQLCYLYLFEKTIITSEILDTVLDLIDDAVGIINQDGIIEHMNKAFCRIAGIDQNPPVGTSINKITHMLDTEPITLKVLREKKPLSMNVKYKNGNTVTHTAVPLFNKNGEIDKVVGTGRDISQLIKLEEMLRETERSKKQYYIRLQEIKNQFGLQDIIYSSTKMECIIIIAVKVAQTDSPIFILGESGVGKEIVARLIHDTSPRKDKPFSAINCAALPAELLESELFGYEEGAFTGAKKGGRKGLLYEANGGTVFLDEIGELPIGLQSKLLRVIQENGFNRLGSSEYIPLNIRYISATNLTKEELKNPAKFRQDLYYRLSVVPIYIPPLRERREDILPMVHYYMRHFNLKYNSKVSLSRNVLEHLYKYDWPGNVRELKNHIERLVILSEQDTVNETDLLWINNFGKDEQEQENSGVTITKIMPLKKAQMLMEETMINRALQEHGSIVEAAHALEIAPSTIYRKVKRDEIHLRNKDK